MEFKEFFNKRRKELDLSLNDVADALAEKWKPVSDGAVGHWATGRNQPKLNDPQLREAIASILQVDVNEMMDLLGYIIAEDSRSKEAQIAAMIVDSLSSQGKELALDYLHTLEKRFAQTN